MKKLLIALVLILLTLSLFAGCTDPVDSSESSEPPEATTGVECEEHSYDEGVVTRQPTCSAVGVKTFTCSVCGDIREEEIPTNGEHSFSVASVTLEPTCTETGEGLYKCVECGLEKTEIIPEKGHTLGEWTTVTEPTFNEPGVERLTCADCDYYEEREIEMLVASIYITIDIGDGTITEFGVGEDGSYVLETPEKVGYNFVCWKDADGNEFPSEGTVSGNVQINAEWELDGTDTLSELIERAAAGVDIIKITDDITVTEPIFFVGETSIYSDENHTIKRDSGYAGDIFVIGQDKNGIGSTVHQKKTVLNLGGGKGILTVDGNRDALDVTVLGSAMFISDSAIINIYDGIIVANNKKLGNERTFTCKDYVGELGMSRPGGAAIVIMNGVVNMYGGIIENNLVVVEHTLETADDGTETWLETAGCGGAIYNRGNFNMYGGIIRNSEALRGGAIYNDEIVMLVSGTISGNLSHSYGGAVSSSSAAEAQMFIGSEGESDKAMIFDGNHSIKAGGVLYSNTSSPIVIYGNTVFSNNSTGSSGGAIYTGGALTLRGATFTGNSSVYSGGAVYLHYSNPDYTRRHMEMTDCVFTDNTASLGGALTLSASDLCTEQGAYAVITNCSFKNNQAIQSDVQSGNGGAMYVTRKSEATISGCEFVGNTASTNAGAIAIHSEAHVKLGNSTFKDNTAALGGAIYTSSNATVALTDAKFNGNKAVLKESGSGGNGGAIFVQTANITFKNVEISNNSAENHAGAVYMCATKLNLDSTVSFKNNFAGAHGGAIYITYQKNEDESRTGGALKAVGVKFENNTALSGGAISARSESVVELTNVRFDNNTTPDAQISTSNGGGAIYANNSTLKLTNVVMDGNMSGYYGGAIKADTCTIELKDSQVVNSMGGTGGAIYASGGSFVADGLTLKDNMSSLNGVVYLSRITATVKNLEASGNVAISGGAIYTSSGAEVSIESSFFNANDSRKGGAICVAGESRLNVKSTTFEGNHATEGNGGVIYVFGANLNVGQEVKFEENFAELYGGAIYVTEHTYTPEETEGEGGDNATQPEPVTVKSTFTIDGASFKNNHALRGGAIYVAKNEYSIKNTQFVENYAEDFEYGGGAIYNTEAIGSLAGVTFTGNFSRKGGAIALHSTSTLTVSSMTATGNEASRNFENKMGLGGVFYVNNSTLNLTELSANDAIVLGTAESGNNAYNGGVIYAENLASVNLKGAGIVNNSAKNGGAVYASGTAAVAFDGVEFTGNKAVFDTDLNGGNGGAIYTSLASLTFKNSEFNENYADLNAGAIYVSAVSLELDSTVSFKSNSAKNHGGAIYVVYKKNGETINGGSLKATGTSFESNTALSGGAISARSESVVELTDVSFKNNTTPDAVSGTVNGGGAIYSNNSTLKLTGVIMDGNSSGYYGGAIKADQCTVELKNTQILNSQGGTGGALYATGATLIADELTLSGNKAAVNGVIYITGTTATFTKLTASGNEAANGGVLYASSNTTASISNSEASENSAAKGGAIYATNAKVNLGNISFSDNNANSKGGAIFVENVGEIVVGENTSFVGNTAANGGAICVYNDATVTLNATAIQNNEASGNGGAILVEGAILNVGANTVFDGNIAGNYGGAIYINDYTYTVEVIPEGATEPEEETITVKAIVTIDGASFNNNTALRGGALYVAKNSYTIKNSEFTSNSATELNYGGGAIYSTGGIGHLSGVTLANNTSHKGGAIALHSGSEMTVSSMTAMGNSATLNSDSTLGVGGVFYLNNATLNLVEGEFDTIIFGSSVEGEGNTAVDGGVIYAENNAIVTIVAAEFIGNSASHYGGAIYAKESEIAISGDTTVFNANTSENLGGAIFVTGSDVELTDVHMSENSATNNGGAFYVTSSTATVIGGSFTKNTAVLGGAVYAVADAQITVENVEFSENTASNNGGAISAANADLIISGENTLFNANTAANHGGAIYLSYQTIDEVQHGATLNMTGGVFSENTAIAGGAISGRTNSDITLTGVSLVSNSTPSATSGNGGGGAIYVNTCKLTMTGVTLDGNSSGYYGGALRADSNATVYLNGNSIVANSTGTTGAALYFSSSSLEAENVTVENNNATQNNNGVVYFNGGTNTLTNITAINNRANNGGLLYISGGTTTVTGLIAVGNSATNGGVIDVSSSATLTLIDVTASGNSAKLGGVIRNRGNAVLTVEDSVFGEECSFAYETFTGNTATKGGAIYHESTKTLTVNNTIFAFNTATNVGGAICANGAGEVVTTDCTFDQNKALGTAIDENQIGRGGGAIYVSASATVTVNGGSFTGNASEGTLYSSSQTDAGGAIMVDGGTLSVNGTEFIGNTGNQGGAIGTSKATTTAMTISNCSFTENVAQNNGGALFIQNYVQNATDSIVISDCSFTNNVATTGAGAMAYVRTDGSATFKNITASGNSDWAKGAIYATTRARVTLLGSVSLEGNNCVYVTGSGTSAVVKYATDAEKTAWESEITTASSATVTYVDVSGN